MSRLIGREARLGEGLLGAIPFVWPLLGKADRRSLRGSCHGTRQRADWLLDALCLSRHAGSQQLAALTTAWCGALARGARPRKLVMLLDTVPAAGITMFGLRLLAALAALSPPALAEVRLRGVPLTAAVVRALAAAAPHLRALQLDGYDLSDPTHPADGSEPPGGEAPNAVQRLLRHAAPHLRELSLDVENKGTAAPWLPLELRRCPQLASLRLGRAASEAVLAELPLLSALTQLKLGCYTQEALPVVAQLQGLVRLELGGSERVDFTLRPAGLQLLAGLTALKHLRLATLKPAAHAADGAGGGPAPQPPAPNTLPLPPHLESLYFADGCSVAGMHAGLLAALRLPPSLTDLRLCNVEGLLPPHWLWVEREHDTDAARRLRPCAAEALLAACGQLVGRTHSGVVQLHLTWCWPPPGWANGWGTLFAALQPVALKRLELRYVMLESADVAALALQLPLLEELGLSCHAPVHAWPLLGRLGRLRALHLYPGMGNSAELWEGFGNEQALRAALLALCMEAPRLERVELSPLSPNHDSQETSAAAHRARARCQAAAAWLDATLPRLRACPPRVRVWLNDRGWLDE